MKPALLAAIVFIFLTPFFLTPPMVAACFAYVILVLGFYLRKRQNLWHQKLMLLGMAVDTSLVLLLQIERNAIQTAISFTLSPLQQLHVGFSSGAFSLYFPLLYLGLKNRARTSTTAQKKWHKNLGITCLVFRTIGFLLMFSLLGNHK